VNHFHIALAVPTLADSLTAYMSRFDNVVVLVAKSLNEFNTDDEYGL
jgi:hypothetical protein